MEINNLKKIIEEIVIKIFKNNMSILFKNLQQIISIGKVVSIDYSGFNADVQLNTTEISKGIKYPSNYTSSNIGLGQTVIVLSPDPLNKNRRFIIAAYGNVQDALE